MLRITRLLVALPALIGFRAGTGHAQTADLTLSTAQPPQVVERGRLFIFRRQNLIGAERYEVERHGDTLVMRATHGFSERTAATTELSAELRLGPQLAPVHFQLHGARELAVEVGHGAAVVREGADTREVKTPAQFFTAVGPAPYAVPMMLVRYWLARGQPDTIPVLPYNRASIRHLGRDTLWFAGVPTLLDRYVVRGLDDFWGGVTLWLDREQALVAAVGGDDSREAIRERFQNAMPLFIRRSVDDALAAAEELSRSVSPSHQGTFALVGGTLVDGTGRPPVPDAVIVVRGGRIAAAGPRATTRIPPEAARIDAAGRTILPGLWDMHVHVDKVPDFLLAHLAAGVTTVRDLGSEIEWSVAFRDALARARVLGPRLLLAGMIDGREPGGNGLVQVATPEEARQAVRRYHAAGYQQIKIYQVVPPALVPVITEEAHRLGMTVTGHIPFGMTVVDAVEAGMDQINHLSLAFFSLLPDSLRRANRTVRYPAALAIDLDGERVRALVGTMLRRGTVLEPTQGKERREVAAMTVATEPGLRRLPPELAHSSVREAAEPPEHPAGRDIYRKELDLLRLLHREGVPIIVGTDWSDLAGHSVHRELEAFVEAGLTPMDAIRAATVVPARVMGLDRELGTVEAGKRADLVVVDGDPLRSIRAMRNVRAVVTAGRMYTTDTLWRLIGVTP